MPAVYCRYVIILTLLAFTACKKSPNKADDIRRVTVNLNGVQEVPAVNSTGSATAKITYNVTQRTIAYELNWALGVPTSRLANIQFHGADDAAANKNSPSVIGIAGFSTNPSGSVSGITRPLNDTENQQLLTGKWYLNIYSTSFPEGELRGNIRF